MGIYAILENPFVYNLSQKLLAPGYDGELEKALAQAVAGFENAAVLELGAGTGAFSLDTFSNLTATDINDDYLASSGRKHRFVNCSATDLHAKFGAASFDLVYSVGLYHHLTDDQYRESLASVSKVLKPSGRFVVVDNMWPTHAWNVPAYLVRRLDRGRFVRTMARQSELLAGVFKTIEKSRGAYSYFRLEYTCFKCTFQ